MYMSSRNESRLGAQVVATAPAKFVDVERPGRLPLRLELERRSMPGAYALSVRSAVHLAAHPRLHAVFIQVSTENAHENGGRP